MLNAKVVLTLPLYFHHMVGHDGTAAANIQGWHTDAGTAGVRGLSRTELAGQIAPRRNGILKACRSISSTINSTVSFTVRPDECVDVMEQMFTQPGVGGLGDLIVSEDRPPGCLSQRVRLPTAPYLLCPPLDR